MLHEFTLILSPKEIESAIERLTIEGFLNVYYDDPFSEFIRAGYDANTVDEPIELKVFVEDTEIKNSSVASYKDRIASALTFDLREINYEILKDNDWEQPPLTIDLGNGWQIRPPSNTEDISEELQEILFEPQIALGSSLHETTQDCLRMILGENLAGQTALDLGAGSGLLSVAASLVGAEKVISIDIEDVNAEVSYIAQLNNINTISVLQANVVDPAFALGERFDFIFANVAANENKELLHFIKSHLNDEGRIILSGMVEWNYREVVDLYLANGFLMKQMIQNNEWVTAYMEKVRETST